METSGSIGGLIPLWILGAPFLIALYELYTIGKPSRHHTHEPPARATYPPATGSVPRTPATGRI